MKSSAARLILTSVLLLASASSLRAADVLVELGGGFGFAFEPSHVFIAPGDTVTFRNNGGFHNVRSDAGGFRCANGCDGSGGNGDASDTSWTVTRRFDQLGNFDIYCEPHGAPGLGMAGVITVEGEPALGPGYSGTWYDPAQSGHGFFIEILPGNQMLVYWFTFSPQGDQAWFGGVGPITGSSAIVRGTQTTGGRFIPNFDPATIVRSDWGELRFSFSDCQTGRVDFDSIAGYGSGSMNLRRLTLPAGLECPAAATAP